MDEIISPNQHTSLKGGMLDDGVVPINEMIVRPRDLKELASFSWWILRNHMIQKLELPKLHAYQIWL